MPVLLHVTTVDMSLALLLLPQLVAFREAGFEVVGVSAGGEYTEKLEQHGIRHVVLERSTRAPDIRADLATAAEFGGVCRRLQPDIVHTHNPKPGVYGRIVGRVIARSMVVNTVHGLYAQPADPLRKRTLVYSLERVAAAFSHAELVQNPEDLEVLRRLRVPEHRLHLLGNGVDLSRFDPRCRGEARARIRAELGLTDGEVVVGLVGRLVAEKGYGEVFEAARRVSVRHPETRFVVAGPYDPDKPDALAADELDRAEALGVRFLGLREDVEDLYAAMDLYVLASHREGFPRSAMEAAAMGVPVIATDIRGSRQVVDHERTGLLVPVRDPAVLAQAVSALCSDPARRSRMGSAGRAKAVREFDDRRQVNLTLEVYERLLARRR